MDELLRKYFFQQLSAEEKKNLLKKIESDPYLKKQFLEIQNNYSLAQMLEVNSDKEYAERKLLELKRQIRRMSLQRNLVRLSRYAAIFLIIVGISFLVKYFITDPEEVQYTEYVAPSGLRKEVTLSDGTKVCLAPSSKIKVPITFTDDSRTIELEGEALFDVVKNDKKPFIVKTSKYDVEVLGTIFSVTAYNPHSFKTSLSEGSVKVFNSIEKLILKSGETAQLQNQKLEKIVADQNEIFYLQSGIYQFDNKPLVEILDMLSSWYNINIIVAPDQGFSKSELTGKFRENDDIETILAAIQQIYPFSYRISSDNNIEIY